MRKTATALFVGLISCAAIAEEAESARGTGVEVGQRIAQFEARLLDASGKDSLTKDFDSHRRNRATLYVVLGTRCPTTRDYIARLVGLEKQFAAKPVDFVYVYPNREETREAKLEFHAREHLRGPLIDDRGAKVAVELGAQKTTEVVLTDARGTIVYRGAIDDSRDPEGVKQRYLETALAETLAGKPVTVTMTRVHACEIHF